MFVRARLKIFLNWSFSTRSSTFPFSNLISAFNCSNRSHPNKGLGELGIYRNIACPVCLNPDLVY